MRNAIAGGVSRTDGDFAVLVSVDLRHDLRVRPIAIVDHANQSVALRLRNRGWWGDLQQAGTSNHRHKRHRRAAHRHTTTPAPPPPHRRRHRRVLRPPRPPHQVELSHVIDIENVKRKLCD